MVSPVWLGRFVVFYAHDHETWSTSVDCYFWLEWGLILPWLACLLASLLTHRFQEGITYCLPTAYFQSHRVDEVGRCLCRSSCPTSAQAGAPFFSAATFMIFLHSVLLYSVHLWSLQETLWDYHTQISILFLSSIARTFLIFYIIKQSVGGNFLCFLSIQITVIMACFRWTVCHTYWCTWDQIWFLFHLWLKLSLLRCESHPGHCGSFLQVSGTLWSAQLFWLDFYWVDKPYLPKSLPVAFSVRTCQLNIFSSPHRIVNSQIWWSLVYIIYSIYPWTFLK